MTILSELERKVLWLAVWIIHHANHVRESEDGLKIGGHQASSASASTLMTALYFQNLRPEDRGAVKPHASPVLLMRWCAKACGSASSPSFATSTGMW